MKGGPKYKLLGCRSGIDTVNGVKDGVFTVELAVDILEQQMRRAAKNKSRVCWQGALKVSYQPMSREHAERIIESTKTQQI